MGKSSKPKTRKTLGGFDERVAPREEEQRHTRKSEERKEKIRKYSHR